MKSTPGILQISFNRPVRFVFERARAPRHFLLGKGRVPYEEIVNFYWSISRVPGGIEAIAFVASMKYQACFNF